MSFKDILIPAMSLAHDEPALRAAELIATSIDAQASALVVSVPLGSEFSTEAAPLSAVLLDVVSGPECHAARERAKIADWLDRATHRFALRDLSVDAAIHAHQLLAQARRSDLSILARPSKGERLRNIMFHGLLFGAGRPLLLMPEDWRGPRLWERILIAWDGGREASRAVADALPFLKRAHDVSIAIVGGPKGLMAGAGDPALVAHLARHGVAASPASIDLDGASEGEALLAHARAFDADLIVMGGYGHSRASEFIFGGVTRELTHATSIPLLLSH